MFSLVFLIIPFPTSTEWYLIAVLICSSLMTCNVEHLFMHLLAIWISSLKKMLIQILCPFLNWTVNLLLSCTNSLYILDINPLVLGFSLLKDFWSFSLLIIVWHGFSISSGFILDRLYISRNLFLLARLTCWCVTVHSSLLWSFVFLWYER